MLLPALITTDLHLTDNPRDEYRWRLFAFLADQCRAESVKTLLILGDLTDAKDYHSAKLTNRIVEEVSKLREVVDNVVIMRGNHDYLLDGHTYFEFLNRIPGVRFIVKPWEDLLDDGKSCLFLPHTKTPMHDWQGMDFSHFDYVFMHQTAPGAKSSNGTLMDGEEMPSFKGTKVYSGDIHVPQVLGDIEYIGSPYPVHHGDHFKGRCVLLDRRSRPVDLFFDSIRRVSLKVRSLEDLKRFDFRPGDHLTLTFDLPIEDKHEWSKIKRQALDHLKFEEVTVNDLSLSVSGSETRLLGMTMKSGVVRKTLTPTEATALFASREELGGDALDMGLDLMGGRYATAKP